MSSRNADPEIPYVTWRDGRPRFVPSPALRKLGYQGEDLKTPEDAWMTAGQCLEWSLAFRRQIERERAAAKPKRKAPKKQTPTAVPLTRAYPVSQLFDDWLNIEQNPSIADLAPKTVKNYRVCGGVIERYANDIWQSETLALDKPICLGLYDKLRSNAGINTAYNTMRALGVAVEWGISRGRLRGMVGNPAHKLKMKTPPPRLRAASIKEIDHLVQAADNMGWPEIGDMVIFAVWSGQRQADRLEYLMEGERDGRIIVKQRKTLAIVSMPAAPALVERLNAAEARREKAGIASNHLILWEKEWQPFKPDYYRHVFDDIRAAAAETMPSLLTLRDQDLRDTAVTWLANAECTIPEICAITGHSFKTANEIFKHYLALNPEMADTAIGKLVAWHERKRA